MSIWNGRGYRLSNEDGVVLERQYTHMGVTVNQCCGVASKDLNDDQKFIHMLLEKIKKLEENAMPWVWWKVTVTTGTQGYPTKRKYFTVTAPTLKRAEDLGREEVDRCWPGSPVLYFQVERVTQIGRHHEHTILHSV